MEQSYFMIFRVSDELQQAILFKRGLIPQELINDSLIIATEEAVALTPDWLQEAACIGHVVVCSNEEYALLDYPVISQLDILKY